MGTAKVKSGSKEGKVQYPYDALVYIDGTVIRAIDKEGNTIRRGVAGTDDTEVIQAAIDTYDNIYISSGDYYITSKLLVRSNTSVFGDGWNTKLYTVVGFTSTHTPSIFGNLNDDAVIPTDLKITIRNIYLNGSATKTAGEEVSGIVFRSVGNVLIENVYGEHFKYFTVFISNGWGLAITSGRSYDVTVRGCYSNDTEYDGIAYTSDYGSLLNNFVTGSLSGGVTLEECDFCVVSGNMSYSNVHGVRSTNFTNGYQNNNVIISNVIYNPTTGYGIYSQGTNDSIVGNTVYRDGAFVAQNAGIWVDSISTTVSQNTIFGSGWDYGIRDNGRGASDNNNIISSNVITGVNRGIAFYGSDLSLAIGNVIKNCVKSGIVSYSSPRDIVIKDNYIVNTTGGSDAAIFRYNQSTNLYIIGNVIPDSLHTYSIHLDASPNVVMLNNVIGSGTTGRAVYDNASSPNIYHNNVGYVNTSEISGIVPTILDILGSPRLLCPCVEITGTSITDYTRNSNTLTAQATVSTWHGCKWRSPYYNFNGTSHYLYRTNDTDFDFGDAAVDQAFSIVACVYADNVASRQIIGKWDANNAREWRLFLDASGYPTIQLYDESIDKYIGRQDQTALVTTGWKVLVVTYDGSAICGGCKIYLDGVQVDDADYTDAGYVAMEAVTANLMVGALKNAAVYSEYWDGKMTWIGVAAKELSADEAWSLTQRLKGVLGI